MAAKLALVLVAAFVLFQLFSLQTNATVVRRDAPATPDKNNDIEEALNSFKQGVEEFVHKFQNSELVQNTTKLLNEFGEKVKKGGEELVQKVKGSDAKN